MQSNTDLHPLIRKILAARGLSTEAEIDFFLNGDLSSLPNPLTLTGVAEAVARIIVAIKKNEKIVLFGDYDVDGITGSAQLAFFLKEVGAPCTVILPHRLEDGYGLSNSSLEKIKNQKPNLLITIDNGTKSKDAITELKHIGVDTIIIDHHETPDPENFPPVIALINPKLPESARLPEHNFETTLASAGLVFIFLIALRSKLRELGWQVPNLKRYLDLACLGTIADVVPLIGTNRLLVKYGLQELTRSERLGIKALKQVSSISETEPITPYLVGFRLAPRINAAGRMAHPQEALQLLLSENDALSMAEQLESYNQHRQSEEEKALKEAFQMVEDPTTGQLDQRGIVVGSESWPLGVVGILAARLTEKYNRPAVVLTYFKDQKIAKGSARSVPGFSVYDALKKIENKMEKFGGHAAAAGMTIALESLEDFTKAFHTSVLELSPEPFQKTSKIDAEVHFSEISSVLIEQLSLLAPFGMGNPEPTFKTSDVFIENMRVLKEKHLKFSAKQGHSSFEAIYFNGASELESLQTHSPKTLVFTLQNNIWNGKTSIQLKIKTIQ